VKQLLTEETFLPTATRQLLNRVCHRAGLDSAEAQLLRHQTNAVYQLPNEQIIVKITRPDVRLEDVQRTVVLVKWLGANGLPTVGLADHITQPIRVANCVATFWRYLPQPAHRRITAAHVGPLLRHLHGLPPPSIPIETLDAVAAIRRSIDASRILTLDDQAFLADRCEGLAAQLEHTQYDLQPGIIHGDPQHRNTLWNGDTPVLSDWESARQGPR